MAKIQFGVEPDIFKYAPAVQEVGLDPAVSRHASFCSRPQMNLRETTSMRK